MLPRGCASSEVSIFTTIRCRPATKSACPPGSYAACGIGGCFVSFLPGSSSSGSVSGTHLGHRRMNLSPSIIFFRFPVNTRPPRNHHAPRSIFLIRFIRSTAYTTDCPAKSQTPARPDQTPRPVSFPRARTQEADEEEHRQKRPWKSPRVAARRLDWVGLRHHQCVLLSGRLFLNPPYLLQASADPRLKSLIRRLIIYPPRQTFRQDNSCP